MQSRRAKRAAAMKQMTARTQGLADVEALQAPLSQRKRWPMEELPKNRPDDDEDWQVDWEAHRRSQLTAAMAATRRLEWLEEMLRLTHRVGALGTRGSRP